MWTQIDKTQNNISTTIQALEGTAKIQLVAPSNISITKGMWLVIEPFSPYCEIREVINPAFNGTSNLIVVGRNFNFNHLTVVDVYIQTSPNWDILLFGADTKSTIVNTIAIRNAAYDCAFNDGGIVSIPKGRYIVNYLGPNNFLKPNLNLGTIGCITLRTLLQQGYIMENVKFVGEGMGVSIIQLQGGNYSTGIDLHIFACSKNNTENIEWHDMTLDGNRPNVNGGEQIHCIEAEYLRNLVVSNVEFYNARRDGIRVGHTHPIPISGHTDSVQIYNCRFMHCGRSGIMIQTSLSNLLIKDNYFYDTHDTDIDGEPSALNSDASQITPTKIIITGNTLVKDYELSPNASVLAISLGGWHGNNNTYDENLIITNNTIRGGCVIISNGSNVVFSNNFIEGHAKQGAEDFAFLGRKILKKFVFTNNVIIDNSKIGRAVYLQKGGSLKTTLSIIFSGNSITNGECYFEDCHDLSFINNKIMQYSRGLHGIHAHISNSSDLSPNGFNNFGSLVINGNQITQVPDSHDQANTFIGILLSWVENDDYHYKYDLVEIDNNIIESNNLDYGISINSSGTPNVGYWNKLIIGKGNKIGVCNIMDIDVLNMSYQIGENPVRTQWISNGNPDDKIDGVQGTLSINKQREADNKYRHNETDGNTGWTLLSEMGKQVLFSDEFIPTGDLNLHIPQVNVFGNIYPWNNLNQLTFGDWRILNIGEVKLFAFPIPPTNPALTIVNSVSDCEIKAVFRNVGTQNGTRGGVVFRLDNTSGNYWCLLFENNSRIISLRKVNTVVRTTSPIGVSFGDSHIFTLKVILKNDFISVFYNDLFLWTVKDNYNSNKTNHGLIIKGALNMFYCRSFKIFK